MGRKQPSGIWVKVWTIWTNNRKKKKVPITDPCLMVIPQTLTKYNEQLGFNIINVKKKVISRRLGKHLTKTELWPVLIPPPTDFLNLHDVKLSYHGEKMKRPFYLFSYNIELFFFANEGKFIWLYISGIRNIKFCN